jgi:hypothetical protein
MSAPAPIFGVRPALQGDPRDVAEWALESLRRTYGLSDLEVQTIAAAIYVSMEPHIKADDERSARIEAGMERTCSSCGCSESRACTGGCVWATETLCSRCV